MGGVREWFGPIPVEADEPVFHHPWQARVFATMLEAVAMLGITEDAVRWAMERLPQAQYLAGYYQRWLAALERLVVDKGALAPGELDAHLAGEHPTVRGHARPGVLRRALTRRFVRTVAGPMPGWLARLVPRMQGLYRPGVAPPRFAIGNRVAVSATPTRAIRGARATRGENAGRSSVSTARWCSPSAGRAASAEPASTSIRSSSTAGSCGAMAPSPARRFGSICSRATWRRRPDR